MTDGRGQAPTPQDIALHGADALDITLYSKGRTPYFIPGIDSPLVVEGQFGVDNFRMVKIPSELTSLAKPVAEVLSRVQDDIGGVSLTEPVGAAKFGEKLSNMSQYQVWGRNEERAIDYMHILIDALGKFGDFVIEGASQEEALIQTKEFLAGLH
jgi:hypothetical protein